MPDPNPDQQRLIDAHEGIYAVDAGPGTGKTFAVTRRYAALVDDRGLEPDDILLLTFTNAAADEMADRIVDHCNRDLIDLIDAPIGTFHSRCFELLQRHGLDAPRHLGIDDDITHTTTVIEDAGVERLLFEEFYDRFVDDHPDHADCTRIVRDPGTVLDVLRQLAAKGIVPTAEGWYRNGESALRGDRDAFDALVEAVNEPNQGARGPTKSDLNSRLNRYGKTGLHATEAPSRHDLRGGPDTKRADRTWIDRAFEEDRSALLDFVHDVYLGYLRYALGRNYLTFGMLQVLAFVLLCEDDTVRESASYPFVMIDEFQDTSEIQFKIALLLLAAPNLCVVGDWKQSIYAFQYADVENITRFEERLDRFSAALNADRHRVDLGSGEVERLSLRRNYRSPQPVIDFAETALVTPATSRDTVDDAAAIRDRIVSLESTTTAGAEIEAVTADDEVAAVLSTVQRIVGNDTYPVGDDRRAPTYGDIAVLSRTHAFGRDLLAEAREIGLPVAYDGDIDLFDTDEAKLVLAWLRILAYDDDRGWALVLEQAGYPFDAIEATLDGGTVPESMRSFGAELAAYERVDTGARAVLDRYGLVGATADAVVTTIRSTRSVTDFTTGDVIRYLERGIEAGWTRSIDTADSTDTVTVQTIHAVKGLEHPIVILANMNRHAFPGGGGGGGRFRYADPVGLRQTHDIADIEGRPHTVRHWPWDVLNAAMPPDYDEERRLLYVALTRAEDHLLLTAGETPSTFFEELPVEPTAIDPEVQPVHQRQTAQSQLPIDVPDVQGPIGLSPHDLIDDTVFDEVSGGRGTARGQEVHDFAEAYVAGKAPEPAGTDERRVAALIDRLDGSLSAEEPVYLPLTVDGSRVTLFGFVDLVCVAPDRVDLIDLKTDASVHAVGEYRKQVSVYYHVLDAAFPAREVVPSLYFTHLDERHEVDPLTRDELVNHVRVELANRR